jgi:RNA-directed DNA polymerase
LYSWNARRVLYQHVGNFVGSVGSPVLANMALDGLERILRKKYPHSGKRALKGMNKQVNLVRYADDFIITGISKEVLELEVKPLVLDFLRQRGLELSEEKTSITHIEEGFDFLGQNVRQWFGQKSCGDSAVRSEFVIAGMIFHPSRVKSELLHK